MMPARTIVGLPTSLRLTLSNDHDEPLDSQLAADGERAVKVAILMIASRDELRHGDKLTAHDAGEAQSATVLRGPGGGQ
jgi:hypothetical protein